MKNYLRSPVFLTLALAANWAFSCDTDAIVPDEIDAFLKGIMEKSHISGIPACLMKNNRIVWSNAYGWADIENKVPMSFDTVQNIASASKTFTATAIMQLWEKGLFKLDDDVNAYLANIRRRIFSIRLI